MLLIGLFDLLSYRTQYHQARDDTIHNKLGLPSPIPNKENVLQFYIKLNFMEEFSQLSLPDDSSLCQVKLNWPAQCAFVMCCPGLPLCLPNPSSKQSWFSSWMNACIPTSKSIC